MEGYTSTVLYMNFQKLFLKWNVKSAIADNWNWIKGIPEAKKANEMLYSQQEMKNVNNIVLSEIMVGRNWLQKKVDIELLSQSPTKQKVYVAWNNVGNPIDLHVQ